MPESDYWSDEEAADKVVGFFTDCLVHVNGKLSGEPFILLPWQEIILREVFGWKRPNGTRRYRKVFIEVPRKNGKSFLAAGLVLYMLLCENEEGGQIYSGASTRDQASLIFSMAVNMLRKAPDPEMLRAVKVLDSKKLLLHREQAPMAHCLEATRPRKELLFQREQAPTAHR